MPTHAHAPIWQLQEAKNRLSEVIHAAERHGPQTITRHGEPVALVVPITHGIPSTTSTAWDLLRDELAAGLGGPPDLPPRRADPKSPVSLPW